MDFIEAVKDSFRWLGGVSDGGVASPKNAITSSSELAKMFAGDEVSITTRVAMRNSAINRCVNLISSSMSQLPMQIILNDVSGSGGEKAKDHPLYTLLTRKPNHWQSASKFKRLMQYKALTDGNAYALPVRSGDRISELIPLINGRMRVEQASDWSVDYIWTNNRGAETKFKPADVFHIMGPSEDGLTGQYMQDVARDVISLSRKSDESMRSMMDKGIRPGGAFEGDMELSEEAFSRLAESIEKQYSGAENQGKWLILEQGLKAKPFTINAKDGQSVELRNQLVEEAARFFGIPRPLMMMDDTSWGSGIEQLAIFYVVYCLGPWFTVWEEEIALKLLSVRDQDKYYAKINERALLRGSMKDQGEYLSKLLGAGGAPQVIEQNEARSLLDMPPHDDGTGLNPGSVNSGASNAQPTP